ncbi:MAG: hypothetical protein CM1200mP35_07390 [Chloroflexota bacterium]|nr:MAG: hypothetical protein CM1200mP35_07390 [Chloroflexota bacterium]
MRAFNTGSPIHEPAANGYGRRSYDPDSEAALDEESLLVSVLLVVLLSELFSLLVLLDESLLLVLSLAFSSTGALDVRSQ